MSRPGQQRTENKDKLIGVGSLGSAIAVSNRTFVPYKEPPPQIDEEVRKQKEEEAQDRCGKLLNDLGWGNGFRVPFATKENQDLEKALEFRQRKILALRSELLDNNAHSKSLEQHLARVKEDIYSYQNLLSNKKSIVQEETNFLGLSQRILNKVSQDRSKYQNRIKESRQRSEVMQKDLDRRLKGILELRDIIEFDSEALKGYQERLKEYEEISGEVRKLSEEDAKAVQELEDSRVELGAQRRELRHELDQEAMNTSKFQEQFDRMSVEFRKVHKQRFEMITMWSSTIQAMSSKDADMKEIADEYYDTRKMLRGLTETIEAKEKRHQQESCSIRGTELLLSEIDRRNGEVRRRLKDDKDLNSSLTDACVLCQMEVQHSCNQTKSLIESLVKIDEQVRALVNRGEVARRGVEKLRDRLRELEKGVSDADSRTTELERILDDEERAAESFLKEIENLRKFYWERSNDKNTTEVEIRNMETTIQRIQNNLDVMQQKEIINLDYVAKRSSNIYRLDLECSILENRISRMINQSVDPRFFTLQNSVRELRETEIRMQKDKKYIAAELEHVQNLIHKCNTDIGKNRRAQAVLEAELQQCDMHSHGLEKLMKQSVKELNEEQVHHSLERVYLKRLTDQLKNERQHMFGLAEIRNTINWAVKERKAEIQNHRVLNLSRQKALSDTVSKLRVQVGEVHFRTDKLRGRFEMVTKLMAGSESGSPEEQTLAYQVRKMAREREGLQTEVHKWKNRLEETEKELHGLMNVQKIMQASNVALKDSLAPADENSGERLELEALNEQEKEIMLRRNRAKKYRTILRDRTEELDQQISVVEQEYHATTQLCQVKEALSSKVENELHRQKEKVNRWISMCSRILREIKESIPPEQYELVQKDLKLRFTISKFESAIAMLERVLVQYPYLKPMVNHFIQHDKSLAKLYYRLNKIVPSQSKTFSMISTFSTMSTTAGFNKTTHNEVSQYQRVEDSSVGVNVSDSVSHRLVQRMSPRSRLLNQAAPAAINESHTHRKSAVAKRASKPAEDNMTSMESKSSFGLGTSKSKHKRPSQF